jgi:hypothetical protein
LFHNLDQGTKPQGQNRQGTTNGLCYRCNDFYGNNNDIVIVSDEPGAPDQGIARSQGSEGRAAKNTFSMGNNSSQTLFDIYNPFDPIEYYFDESPGPLSFVEPLPVYGVQNQSTPGNYNKNDDCPSHFSYQNTEDLKDNMDEARAESDSIAANLNAYVDGGSTEELVEEVNQSTPLEALDTRDQLLENSPYLSDSVMKAAVTKEEVMPNAMIRDVLVENPQSAKSSELLDLLDQRFIPMPDSMMAEILTGVNILGPKESMETELLERNGQASFFRKLLIRTYSEDTTVFNVADSLKLLLMNEGELNSYYELVSLYFNQGMYSTGEQTLDSIPLLFDLSESEMNRHQDYVQLFSIRYKIDTSSVTTGALDSLEIQVLTELSNQEGTLTGAYARDILLADSLIEYQEPILEPGSLKSGRRWENFKTNDAGFEDFRLRLWPNPACDYIIVEYRVRNGSLDRRSSYIVIADMNGKQIKKIPTLKPYDQMIIPVNEMKPGNYLLQLNSGKKIRRVIIFTVIK